MQILLLTDIPPCTNYTAGLVTQKLCEFLFDEAHSVSCIAVLTPSLSPAPAIPSPVREKLSSYNIFNKPFEGYGRRKAGRIQSTIFNTYHRRYTIPKLATRIVNLVQNNHSNIDIIWIVIQGQTMIELSLKVVDKLKKDYVVQVWDPPEWWLREYKFDAFSYKEVMADFGSLLSHSKCCLAASANMAKEYSRLYGMKSVAVMPSLPIINTPPKKHSKKIFQIGFSGQIYAKNEFLNFIKALDRLGWRYGEIDITLNLFSNDVEDIFLNNRGNIKNYGWVPQDKLLQILSEMDLCYCPYRFDSEFEIIARLSFPAKLTSYLSVGSPTFIHAPAYSSISSFLEDGVSGYVCNSDRVDVIADYLKKIINDRERRKIGDNGHKKFLEFLTDDVMKKTFFSSLEVSQVGYEGFTDKQY